MSSKGLENVRLGSGESNNASGWRLKSILYLNFHICKYGTVHAGSSYVDLPDTIKYKQAHCCSQ